VVADVLYTTCICTRAQILAFMLYRGSIEGNSVACQVQNIFNRLLPTERLLPSLLHNPMDKTAFVRRGKLLAQQIQGSDAPGICVVCLETWGHELLAQQDKHTVLRLRQASHNIWQVTNEVVTGLHDHVHALRWRAALEFSTLACPKNHGDPFAPDPTGRQAQTDALNEFARFHRKIVTRAVAGSNEWGYTSTLARNVFQERIDAWPAVLDQLFPHGPRQTVDSHVFWCTEMI